MREQFASQRHPVYHSAPHSSQQHYTMKVMLLYVCQCISHCMLYVQEGRNRGCLHTITVSPGIYQVSSTVTFLWLTREVAAEHLANPNHSVHGETRSVDHPNSSSSLPEMWPLLMSSIDSGVGVDISPSVEATPPSVDEEMNLALIRLQTLAAVISTNLQRAEYTSSH